MKFFRNIAAASLLALGAIAAQAQTLGTPVNGGLTLAQLKARSITNLPAGATIVRSGTAVVGDMPAVNYILSTSPCSINGGDGDDGVQVRPSVGTGCWIGKFPGNSVDISIYNPAHNFIADDSVQIQAALDAVSGMGGGEVVLGPFSYTGNGTITVPKGVRLRCVGIGQDIYKTPLNFTAKACAIYSKVTGTTPAIDLRGALKDIMVLQWNVHAFGNPGSRSDNIALVSGFTGIGVAIGDGTNPGPGNNTEMEGVTVGGFATCINSNFTAQDRKSNVFMDCTNGYRLNESHDDDKNEHLEFWEFLTTNRAGVSSIFTISGVADNGSGLFRITTSTPHDFTTGLDIGIYPNNTGTAQGATGKWTITVINSTTFDLVGSEVAPTRTIGTTNNSDYVTVNSTTNLRRGMTISGTGIPAGATITGVWQSQNAISISALATATGSTTGTFGSVAYGGSGLSSRWNGNYRSGAAFYFRNSEGGNCNECFPFASESPFVLENAVGFSITNSHIDGNHTSNSNTSVGVNFLGLSYNNYLQFSTFAGPMYGVLSAGSATAGFPNTVISNRMFAQGVIAEVGQTGADLIVIASGGADNPSPFLNYGTGRSLIVSGSAFSLARVQASFSPAPWYGDAKIGGNYGSLANFSNMIVRHPVGPIVNFWDDTSATNAKNWRIATGNGQFNIQTLNDANNSASSVMTCTRSGQTPSLCLFGTPIKPQVYNIATLLAITCNAGMQGAKAYVSDTVGNAAPAWHATVAGGGANAVQSGVVCNGTNWIYE